MNSAPKLNLTKSMALWAEGKTQTPGGMLGIRRPYNYIEGEYPIFIKRGYAGHIVDVDDNDYIDLSMSYGPIIIGFVEEEINNAVIEQMQQGFCFSLVQEVQNRLHEKLIDLIPCAEMVILGKTGSDVTTMAVRASRAYSGKNTVLRCGYHGWHDWCVENKGGVPKEVVDLTVSFEYGDLDELREKLEANKDDLACIIITPVGHPTAKDIIAPPEGYLEGVRALADEYGVILVFDEIRTGFRVAIGGAGERYGVVPDMATFGKAMANGYPISALVGKREIMSMIEKGAFVSSTFFPNTLEMVASLKCIEILQREKVCDSIWERGGVFLEKLHGLKAKHQAPITVSGIPPMPYVTFDKVDEHYKERRTAFYTQTVRRGLFLQPYHHWYICHRHTDDDLEKTLQIIDESLAYVMEEYPVKL